MCELVHTIYVIERYTPAGPLDELTVAALKAEGFQWEKGSWTRKCPEWKMVQEDTILARYGVAR